MYEDEKQTNEEKKGTCRGLFLYHIQNVYCDVGG
jgi:hypothetical protein